MRTKLNNWHWMVMLIPAVSVAQVSEYRDCSSIQFEEISSGPLTREEEVALLDDLYYAKVADLTRCEQAAGGEAGSGDAGGSVSGGLSGAGDTGASAANSGAGAQAAAEGTAEPESMSDNLLLPGEASIAITDAPTQQAASGEAGSDELGQASGKPPKSTTGSSGRGHEDLDEVDNRAALRAQIKAQADAETDPVIKKKLMEQYEALE